MGWILAKEAGRWSGEAPCRHHKKIGTCEICAAEKAAEKAAMVAAMVSAHEAMIDGFTEAIPLKDAETVVEVEDYLDYEQGTMQWVPRNEFILSAPEAVFLEGKVWTYKGGNALNWR